MILLFLISGKSLDFITHIINSELTTVSTWFNANLLSLNIKKTNNYILFSNKTNPDIQILIGNEKVARVFKTKFLGITIQANLKKNLYQSLIEPYLTYCCIVWAKPDKTTALETLLKLQKRSVRIISHSWYRACSRPLFHKFSILMFTSDTSIRL